LKTHALTTWHQQAHTAQTKADIARAFEEAAVETLVIKCRRALQQTGLPRLVIAGGVGANQRLRYALGQLAKMLGITLFYPKIEFCTDNGAMIAYTGYLRLMQNQKDALGFNVRPRWPLSELS